MNPQLSFGGTPLPPDESVKVLRRTFDSKLSYRLHLRQVASRAKQRLGLLRKAAPLLSHAGRVTVCKGFVRPMLEYAPLAWMGPAPSHLAMLDAVQLRALNVIAIGPGTILPSRIVRRKVSALCLPGSRIHDSLLPTV